MPFERDEGEYAYSAWILRQGIMPYENSFLQKPPMIIYTYLLGQIFFGDSIWPPRFLTFISVFLTALVIYFVVRKNYSQKVAWASAFLTSLTLSFPHFTALAANTEIFMILFLAISFAFYFYYQEKASFWVWFLSGISSSISIFYKPIAVFPLLFLYSFWIYRLLKQKISFTTIFINIFAASFSFLFTSLLILLPFLISGKINFLVESVWQFNLSYGQVWKSYGMSGFYLQMGKLIRVWWILILLFLFFLFSKSKDKNLILGLIISSIFSTFRTTIGHYYLTFMPFLSIAAALGLSELYSLLSKKFRVNFVYIFLFVLFLMLYPLRVQFGLKPEELSLWIYGFENPFNESKLISEKIVENSLPSDYIFVVGSEPQIYFYSQRRSLTRFVITYPLNIYSPKREEYQSEVVENLKNLRPKFIVYSNKEASGVWEKDSPRIFVDYINNLISKDYYLIGGSVWGRNKVIWQDKLTDEEKKESSLLLYKLRNE